MKCTMYEHDILLRACAHPRATEDQKNIMAYVASMAAANEPISKTDYVTAMQILSGPLAPLPVEAMVQS